MCSPARAVIVAGGKGTRLHALTGAQCPKALYPVLGVPVIIRQLRALAAEGFREVALCAGHLANVLVPVAEHAARGLGLRLEVLVEPEPLGTAGSLPALRAFAAGGELLVLFADMIFDLSLQRLLAHHRERGAAATIVVRPNDHPERSDLVRIDEEGRIRELVRRDRKQPGRHYRNLVPASIFCLSPRVFDRLAPGRQDYSHDLFPRLLAAGERLEAYLTPEYAKDMGTPEGLAAVERDLAHGLPARRRLDARRPAVFFDRDGTLNRARPGHGVLRPEELELLPGAAEAVRGVNDAGELAVLVTNQPQLAKGLVDEETLEQIHGKLEAELAAQAGAWLDRIYHCPHHPERGHAGEVPALKVACECRKPRPGMLLRAARELPIDLGASLMIGDSWRDREAARAAGVRFVTAAAEARSDLRVA